jgi:sugar phosphate isomerase/epimerase
MERREFLLGAAMVSGFAALPRGLRAQAPKADPAKLARIAIMSLSFQPILKNANMEYAGVNPGANLPADQPQLPRTLDLMDIGQVFADKWGVHNVEMQHTHFPSTEDAWLKDFKAQLAKTRSRVSNINLEFGAAMTISAPTWGGRLQAIDLTKQWVDHAVVLGCPTVMVNQGNLNEDTKAVAIESLKRMADYAKTKAVKITMENRGSFITPTPPDAGGVRGRGAAAAAPAPAPAPVPSGPPAYPLLVEVFKASGAYANCDMGNFPDQDMQLAGVRAMLPLTGGNSHVKMNHERYDLAKALQLAKQLGYNGLISIEANANLTNNPNSPDMGKDPYENVQKIFDVVIANI